jgi:hypothetical protein
VPRLVCWQGRMCSTSAIGNGYCQQAAVPAIGNGFCHWRAIVLARALPGEGRQHAASFPRPPSVSLTSHGSWQEALCLMGGQAQTWQEVDRAWHGISLLMGPAGRPRAYCGEFQLLCGLFACARQTFCSASLCIAHKHLVGAVPVGLLFIALAASLQRKRTAVLQPTQVGGRLFYKVLYPAKLGRSPVRVVWQGLRF